MAEEMDSDAIVYPWHDDEDFEGIDIDYDGNDAAAGVGGVGGAAGGGAGGTGGGGGGGEGNLDDYDFPYDSQLDADYAIPLRGTGALIDRRVLRAGWEHMPVGVEYLSSVIFSAESTDPGDCGGDESAAVLSRAFGICVNHGRFKSVPPEAVLSHSEILRRITLTSNLSVLKVTRVQNMANSMLYDAFGSTYNIASTAITAYHGTDSATATMIAKRGFRGACSKRSMWGKGTYVSKNIWEAIAYAQPSANGCQTFIVVDLMTGPIIVGSQDLVDFGQDAAGNPVLTTTNFDNTILCAAYTDQMLATYIVTIRFNVEKPNSGLHEQTVRIYHPMIMSQYLQARANLRAAGGAAAAVGVGAALASAPAVQAPRPRALPVVLVPRPRPRRTPLVPVPTAKATMFSQLKAWNGFALNDRVQILSTSPLFKFCDGKKGTIRAIIRDRPVFFCVQVDGGADIALEIQSLNLIQNSASKLSNISESWFRCFKTQIAKI